MSKVPFSETFPCNVAKRVVRISGFNVELHDLGGLLTFAEGQRECLSSSTCGVAFGSPSCPHHVKLKHGN